MKTYLTNFDFEECLKKENFQPPKYNKVSASLEFIFFWLCKKNEQLYTEKKYDQEYLAFIQQMRGQEVYFTQDKKTSLIPWWGKLESENDWLKEREVNSNITSQKIREKLNLNTLNSKLITNKDELNAYRADCDTQVVFKEEFGFSGRGLHFDTSESMSFPVVGEKYVQRVRDFGIRMTKDGHYLVQNLIDSKGAYKGSLVKDKFEEGDSILTSSQKIFEHYRQQFSLSSLQIDCFQYLEEGELKFNPLCEVNHRKSMGGLAWNLHKEFGDNVSLIALVHQRKLKKVDNFKDYLSSLGPRLYNRGVNKGIIPLSPSDSSFRMYFITEESERTLQHLVKDWWKAESVPGERLPAEFVVYF